MRQDGLDRSCIPLEPSLGRDMVPVARVFLVSTYHSENGLVTVDALTSILESLSPEVIFLEIPPAAFEEYESGSRANLESTAARRYRVNHDVILVPADMATPEASFFRYDEYLHRRVEQTSPGYRQLMDQNSIATSRHGFAYLNSDACSKAWKAIGQAVRVAVERLPDRSSLIEHLALATEIYDRRDETMLRTVEEYCRMRRFATGALLAGAAHRSSLIAKVRERPEGAPRIEWTALEVSV